MTGFLFTFTGCNKDDIDDLKDRMDDVEGRVTALETLTKQLQSQIDAVKHISDVSAKSDGSGWAVTFSDNSSIDVLHGETGTGADPVTPYIYVDSDGYWCMNCEGEKPGTDDPTERILDASGNAVKATSSGSSGSAGRNGNYVTVARDATAQTLTIKVIDGASGTTLATHELPYSETIISSIIENDDFIQFNIYNSTDDKTTGYRFAKAVTLPTSLKIANPIVATDAVLEEEYTVILQVSPSTAAIQLENIYFDYVGEGLVSRTDPEFDDLGYFDIISVTRGSDIDQADRTSAQSVYNDGDWHITFKLTGAALYNGGITGPGGMMLVGPKFDVCVAYTVLSSVVVADASSSDDLDAAGETAYSRTANSFSFSEQIPAYVNGDAAFDPISGSVVSTSTDGIVASIKPNASLVYPSSYVQADFSSMQVAFVKATDASDATIQGIAGLAPADYITVTEKIDAQDVVDAYTIIPTQSAFIALESANAAFVPGSKLVFTVTVPVETDGQNTEDLTYTVTVVYSKTAATVYASSWLPIGADIPLAAINANNVFGTTGLTCQSIATDGQLTDFDANAGASQVTVKDGITAGEYVIIYTFKDALEVEYTLTQNLEVVAPTFSLAAAKAVNAQNKFEHTVATNPTTVPMSTFVGSTVAVSGTPKANYPALGTHAYVCVPTFTPPSFTVTQTEEQTAAIELKVNDVEKDVAVVWNNNTVSTNGITVAFTLNSLPPFPGTWTTSYANGNYVEIFSTMPGNNASAINALVPSSALNYNGQNRNTTLSGNNAIYYVNYTTTIASYLSNYGITNPTITYSHTEVQEYVRNNNNNNSWQQTNTNYVNVATNGTITWNGRNLSNGQRTAVAVKMTISVNGEEWGSLNLFLRSR
jgi:hypothetical protein